MMLQIRKLAVLATFVAIVSVPAGAKALPAPLSSGPLSITMSCSTGATILSLGHREFDLTDVTIANADTSPHTVGITNTYSSGVQYAAGANSTVTQKFETPIAFIGAINNPFLFCDSTTSSVQVSLQGILK